ncbi:hypothetical protein JMJ35_007844 [Cladonia borealis]|uniref:Rhodopsin domain-containing protein n=1 Tax=Cladonia borealis TaxID=184061 RepID=A0AA39QWN6_9LECA|nr:hypothetical protein JMJ35_007844 [Cladonia borealis]
MDQVAPPGIDLEANQQGRLVSSMIALIILPTIFVILRLISRKVSQAGYWWDDVWVTIACALCYIQCTCVLISERHNGFGRHIYVLENPLGKQREFLKILYVYEIGYYTSTSAVKIAILTFYRRIFPVQQLRLLLYIAMGVVAAYFTAAGFATIFQCTPIHRYWDLTQPGRCVNGDNILIVPGAVNCVLDFLIIILPLPLLWRLRTSVPQKGVLTGIFICAGFVCIISIIRLVVLSRLTNFDVTWNFSDSAIWSTAEPCMGVISACLTTLRPLISILTRGTSRAIGYRGLGTGHKSSPQDTSRGSSRVNMSWRSRSEDTTFNRLEDATATRPLASRWGHETHVKGGKARNPRASDISLAEINVPEGGIMIKEEVVVTSSDWLEYKYQVY